jgi:hypothetical protein
MTAHTIKRYIAHVLRPPGRPSADPVVRVSAGQFARKPNSWRRIEDGVTDSAWGYLVLFRGVEEPGCATPEEAVRGLLAESARTVSSIERCLVRARADVAAVEAYLREMDDE